MRFNRNVLFDEMKARINAKILRRCGRRISKIFYKFPVSTNPVKFVEMELVDDEDVETMVDLYCGNESDKNAPIHLFAELAGMEQNEDVNASDEEHGAQELWMVAPISYVDKEGGGDHWDEEVDSDGDPDVDDVLDDIDDEDVSNDEGINASSVGEQMQRILIHNNPGPHMSLIDPDAAYVAEFSEYPEIVHPHGLAVTSDDEELFIGQKFNCKEDCVYAIKRYSMNISVDYKVAVSTPTIYVGECWKAAEGCNWRVRAAFIRSSQMWEIRKFVGPHTCTSTRMIEDHGKLDLKTISYELEPHIFRQRMIRLESDMEGQTNTSFRQWLGTMEPWQWAQSFDEGFRYGQMTSNLVEGINAGLLKTCHLLIAYVFSATFYRLATFMPRMGQQQVDQIQAGHVFVEHVRDAMVANLRLARSMNVEIYSRRLETFRVTETISPRPGIPTRSYGVDLRNRRCECKRFETVHYPCAHVVAACAKVNLDVEQYVDDMYTLERTLRVWENEFPILPDLSTWEVSPATFELLPDRGLRRNPRGRLQSSRIRNEMDIREKFDGKHCGICRGIPIQRSTIMFWATTNIIIQRRMSPMMLRIRVGRAEHTVLRWDPDSSGPLLPIPQVAARAGGLQSTGLQVGSHNHLRSSMQSIVPQRHKFSQWEASDRAPKTTAVGGIRPCLQHPGFSPDKAPGTTLLERGALAIRANSGQIS
ncbi:hypothetical protein GOBAR_DD06344 [Gossypium barbadense]|nr:hypothetical protein GOBAR_DD06344 [Gossypium barbadense]